MLTGKFGDREKKKDWDYFVALANSRKRQNEPLDLIFNRFFAEDAYNFEPYNNEAWFYGMNNEWGVDTLTELDVSDNDDDMEKHIFYET